MTEAECHARLYGGPRHIEVIRPGRPPVMATLTGEKIRRLFERRLGRKERKAA
jgi:hypothetical protein